MSETVIKYINIKITKLQVLFTYAKNYICQTNIYVAVFHKVSLCISFDQLQLTNVFIFRM